MRIQVLEHTFKDQLYYIELNYEIGTSRISRYENRKGELELIPYLEIDKDFDIWYKINSNELIGQMSFRTGCYLFLSYSKLPSFMPHITYLDLNGYGRFSKWLIEYYTQHLLDIEEEKHNA